MRPGHRPALIVLLLLPALLAPVEPKLPTPVILAGADEPAPASAPAGVDVLEALAQLGHADFRVREAGTQALLAGGEELEPLLRQRLALESDAEVRYRLRFVLENIRPPAEAVLVIRGGADRVLGAGTLITHVENRRVRGRADLFRRIGEAPAGISLRIRDERGPRDVHVTGTEGFPMLCDYRVPRGPVIAAALREYDQGYAERAWDRLCSLPAPPPETELPQLLRAILAYTAGDADTALTLLEAHPEACQPYALGSIWNSPSWLDLAGPRKAPYHLEWLLWQRPESQTEESGLEPDTPIQRVLVPAGRYLDALQQVSELWWWQYRGVLGQHHDTDRRAGNLLAVAAWMLSEVDLLSECLRLVEPRSEILRRTPQGVRKWIRVRTDAWLPYLQGDLAGALDSLYDDARSILQPPGPPPIRMTIQNPRVAATIAFFLYQAPQDERVGEMLGLVNQPAHPALEYYGFWMLFALHAGNFEIIATHFPQLTPAVPPEEKAGFALAGALLEYVRAEPRGAGFAAAREQLALARDTPPEAAALLGTLEHLAHGRADEALAQLESMPEAEPGSAALRWTARFCEQAAGHALPTAVQQPILAVPEGLEQRQWIVLTRGRELVRYAPETRQVTPLPAPTPDWFPGPLNWPWLGREESSGRVWAYAPRRVIELTERPDRVQLNVTPRDVVLFDYHLRSAFTPLAQAVALARREPGETAEFLRADLAAGQQYFSDPDLPELAFIRPVRGDDRIVHVALRGGPHLLLEPASGRAWDSPEIARQLGLPGAPRFLAQAVPEQATPLVFLFSEAGLIRFDADPGTFVRIPLPGEAPYPRLIPEHCPYVRRDPRWVYAAREPADGGAVFRVSVADNSVETLSLINEAVSDDYYLLFTRHELRAQLDTLFESVGLPPLNEFIAQSIESVTAYTRENQP